MFRNVPELSPRNGQGFSSWQSSRGSAVVQNKLNKAVQRALAAIETAESNLAKSLAELGPKEYLRKKSQELSEKRAELRNGKGVRTVSGTFFYLILFAGTSGEVHYWV